MEPRDVLSRIMGLFSAEELKGLARQVDVKGTSKLNKGGLIKAIIDQSSSDAIDQLVKGEGKRKIQETIKGALSMIEGNSLSGERLGRVIQDDDRVDVTFDGIRWSTRSSMTIASAGDPMFEFTCTCKVADTGALCVHYWVMVIRLVIDGKLAASSFGPFAEMASSIIDARVKRASAKVLQVPVPPVDVKGKSLPELLQAWTDAGRYHRAIEELWTGAQQAPGMTPTAAKPAKPSTRSKTAIAEVESKKVASEPVPTPEMKGKPAGSRPKKARVEKEGESPKGKKPPAEKYLVQVEFLEAKPGPPARYLAMINKITSAGKVPVPFRMLVDEGEKLIAHDGCMDFDMRLRRKQLLCKHLLQTFMGMEEHVAIRVLAQLDTFEFRNVVPRTKQTQLELPASVRDIKPEVLVSDDDLLKGKIMDYLFAHEGNPDELSVDTIQASIGTEVEMVLAVLKSENMVDEFKPGHFKAK